MLRHVLLDGESTTYYRAPTHYYFPLRTLLALNSLYLFRPDVTFDNTIHF
jgi:hypothetical protein